MISPKSLFICFGGEKRVIVQATTVQLTSAALHLWEDSNLA